MRHLTLLCCLVLLSTGCATRAPFTQQLRQELELSNEDLKHMQFFLAGEMVLYRASNKDQANITRKHNLRLVNDTLIEEIMIRSGTPAIAEKIEENAVFVSFEEGKLLNFGSDPEDTNNWQGKYMLIVDAWEGEQGELSYDGKPYQVKGDYASLHLLVNLNEIDQYKKRSRVLKGRRLNNELVQPNP
ncbi:MAG: hypothetical protein ACE5EH_01245 [Gammaproteobacteria bacterium]